MIDKSDIEAVINEWSYRGKAVPKSIARHPQGMPAELPADIVINIQGVRRSGKSTFLHQIVSRMGLNRQHCFFINFEDARLSEDLNVKLLDTMHQYALSCVPGSDPLYFFLDEIQNIEGWEKWLRTRISLPDRCRFVITGSNASLLSGDLGTVLTGRHLTVEIFPFDLFEYRMTGRPPDLDAYLSIGGFPRPLTFENPGQLLREYFVDIIEKDVRRHVNARSSLTLQQLVKSIFESTGSELSQRKLANTMDLSADTIGSYIGACESAYLLFSCPYFSFSQRQRAARNKKFYPVDTGIKNAVSTKKGRDYGKDFETIVFHRLRKLYATVCYWRGRGEVDFVVQTSSGILPIQVSWDHFQDRHYDAVKEFNAEFKDVREALYISRDNIEEFLSSPL